MAPHQLRERIDNLRIIAGPVLIAINRPSSHYRPAVRTMRVVHRWLEVGAQLTLGNVLLWCSTSKRPLALAGGPAGFGRFVVFVNEPQR